MGFLDEWNIVPDNKGGYGKSKFTGSGFGFFGMKMLGVVMVIPSLFTLGFAGAWYFCFFYRWLAGHTHINGRQLKFSGTAKNLWVQKLVWWLVTVLTLGIFSFFLSARKQHWLTRNIEAS